nr:MAG TPA: hypothetical protein [Caudoviricetes sp.]
MVTKQNNEIFSTEEKYVHIKNTDVYFKRAVAVCLSVEQCEEVDEVPNIRNEEDYGNQVNDLIRRRYSLSEELAILRQKDEKPDEYRAYFAFCEECKAKAKVELEQNKET